MKKERLVLVVCLLSINFHLFGQLSTGALWSVEKAATVELVKLDTFLAKRLSKSLSPNPTSYYLSTPTVGNQGKQGSCSGWAVGYAATSILAYDKYGQDWTLATMSPSYIYNQAKATDDCSVGAYLVDALNIAKEHGNCRLREMPYTDASCSQMPTAAQHQAASYNTLSYVRINSTSISDMCTAIANQYPIVVGLFTTSSFRSMWYSDGIWRVNERSNNDGYHFCCIVGYDNANRMFKVQNSWGSINGDNGFFWVTYDLVSDGAFNEAYVLYNLNPSIDIFIQGPSQFCDTAVYTLENVPAGATIEWKYSPNTMRSSALRIVRGQGSASVTFQRGFIMNGNIVKPPKPIGGTVMKAGDGISRPFSGAATVMATVTMNNGTSYTVSKAVTLPPLAATETPIVNGWNNSLWYVDISHTLNVVNCDSVPDGRIVWEVHLPGRSEPISHVGRSVTFKPTASGTVTVIVANTESCSAANRDTLTHTVRFKPIISYANPVRAAETVEISVSVEEQTADFATVTVPYAGEYTLELWSELYGRVRTVEADTPTTQMSLSGLNAGTYFLKLIINNEIVATQQLIIK